MSFGGVNRSIMFANQQGSPEFHAESRDSIKPFLMPWHSIPLDIIGPYAAVSN